MKLSTVILVVILLVSGSVLSQGLVNGPECVTYDSAGNRYFVSNWTDGTIVVIDSLGNQSYFGDDYLHVLGNEIIDSILFVTDGILIYGYHLETEELIWGCRINGAVQIQGICALSVFRTRVMSLVNNLSSSIYLSTNA